MRTVRAGEHYASPTTTSVGVLMDWFRASILPVAEPARAGGSSPPDPSDLRTLATALRAAPEGLPVAGTIAEDLRRWADHPDRPDFEATREAMRPPGNGRCGIYVGPVFLPNSGSRTVNLEAFLVLHDEPPAFDELRHRFPYDQPTCQPVRLLAGTSGVSAHNNVVFFPENIPAPTPCERQNFAWFFFSKHSTIYSRTLDLVAAATQTRRGTSPFAGERGVALRSAGLSDDDVYAARSVWGYLHDHFHQTGIRPLHEHLAMKTTWAAGGLEELRVDTRAALACVDHEVPFWDVVVEYILLERLFRYPAEPDATDNADSASGVALATWLVQQQALEWPAAGPARLGTRDEVVTGLRSLADHLEAVERTPVEEHEAAARQVLDALLDGGLDGDGFRFPERLGRPG